MLGFLAYSKPMSSPTNRLNIYFGLLLYHFFFYISVGSNLDVSDVKKSFLSLNRCFFCPHRREFPGGPALSGSLRAPPPSASPAPTSRQTGRFARRRSAGRPPPEPSPPLLRRDRSPPPPFLRA